MEKLLQLFRHLGYLSKYGVMSFLILSVSFNSIFANAGNAQLLYETEVRYNPENNTIGELFRVIEAQTEFSFVYNPEKINLSKRVTLTAYGSTVAELLEIMANQAYLSFKQNKYSIVVKAKSKPRTFRKVETFSFGLITGRVVDATTGDPLPGAGVRLVGTTIGTATDLNGEFNLRLDEGVVELECSYIGFRDITRQVNVPADGSVFVEIRMSSAMQELEAVTVSGTLQGQQRALNQQRSADNIKNVISAEQIGRFPDSNTAEALQRVPGININRNEGDGEGRYVGVRGLPAYFTNISINGEQTPSPEGGVRQTALDAIPADQLASIEVIKSITPDMDGDAIAGSVNLITRTANSREWRVTGTLAGEYQQNNAAEPGYQTSIQLAKRFGGPKDGNGKFGALINYTVYKSNRNVDMVESGYDIDPEDGITWEEMELEDAFYIRNRVGLSGSFDYKPNDRTTVYLNTIFTQLYELDQSRRWFFEESAVGKRIKHRQEDQGVQSYNLGARHTFDKFDLDYEVSYSRGNATTPYEHLPVFGRDGGLDIKFNRDDVQMPVPISATLDGKPFNFLDDTQYKFLEYEHSGTSSVSNNITAKFNIERPFTLSGNKGTIKFGAKARQADKNDKTDFFNLYEFDGNQADGPSMEFFTSGSRVYDRKLLGGDYWFGNSVEWEPVAAYVAANPSQFENVGGEGSTDFKEEVANRNYFLTENVYAAYAMGTLQLDKLTILGGLRYEATTLDVKTQIWDADNELILPVNESSNYGFLLPMLHLKYRLDNMTNFRFAVTKTYARPNFEDIVSDDKGIDREDEEAFIGNTALRPVQAWNFDLMAERYFGNVGIVSVGLFHKSLTDFIYQQARRQTYLGTPDILVFRSENGSDATLTGFELAWQQNLTMLPGILKGLGIYANYTRTFSDATYNNRAGATDSNGNPIVTEVVNQLVGQSEHVFNAALSYQIGGFQARFAANYNSAFIAELEVNQNFDFSVASRWQFDASASQRISKAATVFVELVNITNAHNLTYYGTLNHPAERRSFGFWGRFGVKFDLSAPGR